MIFERKERVCNDRTFTRINAEQKSKVGFVTEEIYAN